MNAERNTKSRFEMRLKYLFELALREAGGNRSKLAKSMGYTNSSSIQNWETGKISAAGVDRLLDYLMIDVNILAPAGETIAERAAASSADPLGVFISGQVAAGKVSFAGEDQHFKSIESLWGKSRYYGLTHGPTIFLEIHGESMMPDYAPGEVIACRAPAVSLVDDIPSGAPCVFQDGDGDSFTFKILRHGSDKEVIGAPLNPEYPFIVFDRSEVRIPFIVLGKVQLEKKRTTGHVIKRK